MSRRAEHYPATPEWWINALMDPRDVNPPKPAEVVQRLMLTGDAFTADFTRLTFHLNRIAPARATMTIETTPPGFAPDAVRQAWAGITLPLRGYFDPHQGYTIIAREAVETLRTKNPEAAAWWDQYYENKAKDLLPQINDEDFPAFLSNISHLSFDINCGTGHLLTNTPLFSEQRPISNYFDK